MHLSALLDCDLVAVEQSDQLTLLVELTAPQPSTTEPRRPATLQVVLDRSGSMEGDRLEGAKRALRAPSGIDVKALAAATRSASGRALTPIPIRRCPTPGGGRRATTIQDPRTA